MAHGFPFQTATVQMRLSRIHLRMYFQDFRTVTCYDFAPLAHHFISSCTEISVPPISMNAFERMSRRTRKPFGLTPSDQYSEVYVKPSEPSFSTTLIDHGASSY